MVALGAGRGEYKDLAAYCLYVIFKRTIFSEVVRIKHRLQGVKVNGNCGREMVSTGSF